MTYDATFFRCNVCGNLTTRINDGGGTMVCCGQNMEKLSANTTEAAVEKHVPAVTRVEGAFEIQVGSTLHPMTAEHHIGFIAVQQGDRVTIVKLDETGEPRTTVAACERPAIIYAWCNLHGLWKAEA